MTGKPMTWRRICCATDFSDGSRIAFQAALELARVTGGELLLVHAYYEPGYALPEGLFLPSPDLLQRVTEGVQQELGRWQAEGEAAGIKVRTATAAGAPAQVIVDTAKHEEQDIIVLGTHGRTGLKHLLLGSIAERVVRTAGRPVLTIPMG